MSITEGWTRKPFKSYTPGIPVTFNITKTEDALYIDNGQEYKEFPNTKKGWADLCETLKDFEP